MDLDKSLGRLAIIVPVFHLITCALFLFGYSWGFGGGAGTLFAVTDFFTVSLDHLIRTYALGLGVPLVFILVRHSRGHPYAADVIAAETDAVKREKLAAAHSTLKTIISWGLAISGLLILMALFFSIYFDLMRLYYLSVSAILLIFVVPFWKLCDALNIEGIHGEFAFVVLMFIAGVIGIGMDAGFRDRRGSMDFLDKDRYQCKDHMVLNTAGSRFITVTKDNMRHVINEECKILFSFPAKPPLRQQSIADAITESLRSRFAD